MKGFIRNNMLFIALVVGTILGVLEGNGILTQRTPDWVVPALLFCMLFLAFCKINPSQLRICKWHIILLVYQIAGCLAMFFLVRPFSPLMAQGLMLCVLMPTATAAPIITDKLGGDITQITAYVMLSNIMTAIVVPLLFPIVNPALEVSYWVRLLQILEHITPLLFVPFFGAWLLRVSYNYVMRKKGRTERFLLPAPLASLPFYLWVMLIVILISRTVQNLYQYDGDWQPVIGLSLGTMIICFGQFFLGRFIGRDTHKLAITVGQTLGQKNSALAIWMAQMWLNPMATLAPALYIIWQNLFNNWQLMQQGKKKAH